VPLILPESIAAEEINAAMEAQAAEQEDLAQRWTAELKRLDPTLSVEWVPEQADEFDYPARWHVRKRIAGSVDEWFPLIGPGGEYREPGSWILDSFQASDVWNPRVHRDRKEAKEKLREAKVRAKKLEAEQRADVMAEAVRAARRVRGDGGMRTRTDKKRVPVNTKKAGE
jgi:hypothetical protein